MNPEQLEPSSSPASALALSNIEEGMGHNAERAQELQEELAQRRASLHQDLAKAQAFQGKETLLANIIEGGWLIRLKYQSCPIYTCNRPKKSNLNPMRLGVYLLCWRNSRLSWSKSKSSRGGCQKCLFLLKSY